uniref:Zinc finger BED domain-containing protein RICESLEEPER 2-like n=1 Tax=Lactuca sativa TaxID=4236 RepID=A0A9R1X0X2_LACSA|nr:hypothetical protein LSAT_V11C800399250 [Lactuca sativa]
MSSDEPIIDLDTDNHEPVTVEESMADKVEKGKENTPTNRKISIVWDHFRKVEGAKKTKCKYCGTLMSSNTRNDCVARAAIECKQKPCLDVDTRWNSTYLMLETAVKYEQAFDRLYTIDSNYGAHFRSEVTDDCEGSTRKRKRKVKVIDAPSESDWETARNMIEYLKIFSDVTTKISDIDHMNFLLYVVVVLDPRFKLRYISFCIETIYGKNSEKGKQILEKVEKTLQELFNYYKDKLEKKKVQNKQGGVSSDMSSSFGDATIDLEIEFDKFDSADQETKSEVDIYLAEGKQKRDDSFDILGWWKANAVKFPILSKLARHVLAMPISTVASESAFSTGGRVIDKYRSSLNTETAEALICTQDWLWSTPADLDLIGTMSSKQIDELNEKLATIEIGKLFSIIRMLSTMWAAKRIAYH